MSTIAISVHTGANTVLAASRCSGVRPFAVVAFGSAGPASSRRATTGSRVCKNAGLESRVSKLASPPARQASSDGGSPGALGPSSRRMASTTLAASSGVVQVALPQSASSASPSVGKAAAAAAAAGQSRSSTASSI